MKKNLRTDGLMALFIIMIIVFAISFFACTKNEDTAVQNSMPLVTTNVVTAITTNSAFCGGEATSDKGFKIMERGICWSTSHNPTIQGSKMIRGDGIGKFTWTLTGLQEKTTYFVRAYATNSFGTGYGNEVSFTTLSLGTWTAKAPFPGAVRFDRCAFSIGNKGYSGCGATTGTNSVKLKDFWEYNPTTNTWSQKADVGSLIRTGAVGFSIGVKGYVGTGLTTGLLTNDFFEYDPATNVWLQKADFSGIKRWNAVGFSIGTKGYIGTGENFSTGSTKDFWEYDPVTNKWTQKADFGGSARAEAIGFSIGSKGYIGLGLAIKDFWEYDQASNTWSKKADFGGTSDGGTISFTIGSKGYVGFGSSSTYNDLWEYDPSTNIWIQKKSLATEGHGRGFSITGKGYFLDIENKLWEFTP